MKSALHPVILTYHSISPGDSPLQTAPQLFIEQLEWLRSNARVVPLSEIVEALTNHRTLPPRSIALTFDDGFADFYTEAARALRKHRFPATVFLPVDYCGRTNSWPGQPAWVTEQPLMSWSQIGELAADGIEFGSHSKTHPNLVEIPEQELEREVGASAQEIEARTGHTASFFCYPYGRWNATVRACVSRHYRGACSTGAGVVERDADPFVLPRVDACYVRSPGWFRSLFSRRFVAYVNARRLVRRLRGQPEGHYARL